MPCFGMHAFTSWDTVSAFAGRGKMGALKLLKSGKAYQEAFSELGRSWHVSDELFEKLQEITCRIYVHSTHTTDVNTLRHQLFCARRGKVDSSQLPPCEDCLFMHAIAGCNMEEVFEDPTFRAGSKGEWVDHR